MIEKKKKNKSVSATAAAACYLLVLVGMQQTAALRSVRSSGFLSIKQATKNSTTSAPANSASNNSTGSPAAVQPEERQLHLHQNNTAQSRASPQWPGAEQDGDTRVPFWNVAHMINSVSEIEPVLRAGANGIEVDISFNKSGYPVETYHGFPCDCARHCHQREKFTTFVKYVSKLTLPPSRSQLQLMLLDLKLKGIQQPAQLKAVGRHLASILDESLYRRYFELVKGNPSDGDLINRPPVRVIVSINHVGDNILIRSFMEYLRQKKLDFMSHHVGFDVGMNDGLQNITSMWDQLNGLTFNVWQGDGLTNCANIVRGIERLKEAISIRNGQGHFRKVYYWTADVMYHIRSVLRLGLDAVLTNQPQRVVQVLDEPEFKSKFRLATPFDDPFAQFWIQPSRWKMSVPTLGEAVETVTNIRQTSSNFVRTLPVGIAAALKKVQSSIVDKIR